MLLQQTLKLIPRERSESHLSWYAAYCELRDSYATRSTSNHVQSYHAHLAKCWSFCCWKLDRVLELSITCFAYCLSFFFPFEDVHRSNKPCIVVLQIITLRGLSFFIFRKVTEVVFPSFGWSSCSPLGVCLYDHLRIPLDSFSGPSFLAPLHFQLCLSTS